LELAVASGERGNEGGILLLLAEISACEDSGELEPAASLYERAKTFAEELSMRPLIATAIAASASCTGARASSERQKSTLPSPR